MDTTKQAPTVEELLAVISNQLEAIMFAQWASCPDKTIMNMVRVVEMQRERMGLPSMGLNAFGNEVA